MNEVAAPSVLDAKSVKIFFNLAAQAFSEEALGLRYGLDEEICASIVRNLSEKTEISKDDVKAAAENYYPDQPGRRETALRKIFRVFDEVPNHTTILLKSAVEVSAWSKTLAERARFLPKSMQSGFLKAAENLQGRDEASIADINAAAQEAGIRMFAPSLVKIAEEINSNSLSLEI